MKKLFLHIGTHKTGTTSFQAYLSDNRARLRREGVAICTERTDRTGQVANCYNVPNAILRPGLMTVARMANAVRKPSYWQYALSLSHVTRFLSAPHITRFVLSAEAFCFARERSELKKIRKMFSLSDVKVIPIICFRNEQDWRESWASEISGWKQNFKKPHGQAEGDIRGDWYFNKAAILRFWEQVGEVRTIDFDQAVVKDGTIVPSLLDAMEVERGSGDEKYFLNARG